VKNLENAIAWGKNGNPTLLKFIHFRPHEDNPNIVLSDKDQELLDKLKIPDFMEKEKSKSPTALQINAGLLPNYKQPYSGNTSCRHRLITVPGLLRIGHNLVLLLPLINLTRTLTLRTSTNLISIL
jgi:hypothetical protein